MDIKDIVAAVLGGREAEASAAFKSAMSAHTSELVKNGKDFIAQSIFENEVDGSGDDDNDETKKPTVPEEGLPEELKKAKGPDSGE